ncbi:MAG: hypothetical protein GX914_01340 [Erysipelotrichia bacterium]|nr:hypothetical protein [Erysipelotrichia bacterium]
MKFEKIKKELQEILAHYSEAIEMVAEETNTFLDESNQMMQCDGYFKLVELIENCHDECQLFIYNNIPENYWQDEEQYNLDYVDEDSYGYHNKHCSKSCGYFYDDESVESGEDDIDIKLKD